MKFNLGDYDLGDLGLGDFILGDLGLGDFNLGDFNLGDFDLIPLEIILINYNIVTIPISYNICSVLRNLCDAKLRETVGMEKKKCSKYGKYTIFEKCS